MIPFGIIGTNWITHSYILGAQSTGRFTLAAVYSRTKESAQTFASQYPDQKLTLHTTLESLASDPTITTVYIASPNSLHYDHAHQMLSAGKHVILEKPACLNLPQLTSLFALAYAKNLILIEAYRHIQEQNFKILQSALASGKIGKIHGARLDFIQFSSRYDKLLASESPSNNDSPPNLFTLDFGGGCLTDLGVYNVSAAIQLFGTPQSSTYYPVKLSTGVDGAGTLILQYATFHVSLTASKMYSSYAPAGEIYGAEGTIVLPSITDIESVKVYLHRKKGDTGEELAGPKEPAELNLKEEAQDHARIIEEGDVEGMRRWEGA